MLSRRSRRFVSEALPWEPTMRDPLRGVVIWPVPENKQLSITLFKDPRSYEHEDKEWTFAIEDVSSKEHSTFSYTNIFKARFIFFQNIFDRMICIDKVLQDKE